MQFRRRSPLFPKYLCTDGIHFQYYTLTLLLKLRWSSLSLPPLSRKLTQHCGHIIDWMFWWLWINGNYGRRHFESCNLLQRNCGISLPSFNGPLPPMVKATIFNPEGYVIWKEGSKKLLVFSHWRFIVQIAPQFSNVPLVVFPSLLFSIVPHTSIQ